MQRQYGDEIVTAWAEHCNGPGWNNTVVWVLIRSTFDELRLESLQPAELTREVGALVDVSAAAAASMTSYVKTGGMG